MGHNCFVISLRLLKFIIIHILHTTIIIPLLHRILIIFMKLVKISSKQGKMGIYSTQRLCNCSWIRYGTRWSYLDSCYSFYISMAWVFQDASYWPICSSLASTCHPPVCLDDEGLVYYARLFLLPPQLFILVQHYPPHYNCSFTHCHVYLYANSCVCSSFICLFNN